MTLQQQDVAEHRDRESAPRRPHPASPSRRPDLPVLATVVAVFIAVVIGAVLYQDVMFAGIQVESQSLAASPGKPLTVQGRFLPGSRLSLGDRSGYIPVEYTADPSHLDRLTITGVPPELETKKVHVRAQRVIPVLPFLSPLMPSAVSKSEVQIGG